MQTCPTVVEPTSRFAVDTATHAASEGSFTATVSDRWNGLAGRPLGGYVLAVALRALGEVMPFPDLCVVSAFFLNPVETGPVEVRTDIARIGHRSATGEARLFQNGIEALRAVATFTVLQAATGQKLVLAARPDLPPAAEAVDLHEGGPPPTAPIADRVEYRVRAGQGLNGTGMPDIALWMRLKEGGWQDLLSIPFLVDAAPPAVMEVGATGSITLELTLHLRCRPSSEWLACRAATRHITNGYHDEDFEVWDDRGNLVAQSRQLAKLPNADVLQTPKPEGAEADTSHPGTRSTNARSSAPPDEENQ